MNCLVSDLDSAESCAECGLAKFFNVESKNCELCSSKINGCAECDHFGNTCSFCQEEFSLENGKCVQTSCLKNQLRLNSTSLMCKDCNSIFNNCGSCELMSGKPICTSCVNNLRFLVKGDEDSCGCSKVEYLIQDSQGNSKCELCSKSLDNCVQCED